MSTDAELPADAHVAEQIRSGNREAFGRLFKASYSRLYLFALGYVHDQAIAEDILSDVFLRLWSNRTNFQPASSIELYLYGAVRNSVLQHFRSTRAHDRRHQDALNKNVVPGMADASVSDPGELPGDDSDPVRKALWAEIAAMPEQRQMIMMLRWREQKSFAEIAEILGMSRPAVQMQVDRALKALRKVLVPLTK